MNSNPATQLLDAVHPIECHQPSDKYASYMILMFPRKVIHMFSKLLKLYTCSVVLMQIAIALGPTVYLWNASTGSIEELCSCPENDYITSVQWATDSAHLAIGTSSAKVQVWDATRCKQVKELPGHTNRVSSLAWNNAILSSGKL